MIVLSFPDIKDFMHKLLCTETFDHFLFSEGAITTFVTTSIDGHLHPDFFQPEEENYDVLAQTALAPFSMIRPVCFQLIKGNRTPLAFKLVLQLSNENQKRTIEHSGCPFTPEDVTGMFINLKYQDQKLTCTTGISYKTFSLDRSLEQEWDRLVMLFFKSKQIPFEREA